MSNASDGEERREVEVEGGGGWCEVGDDEDEEVGYEEKASGW